MRYLYTSPLLGDLSVELTDTGAVSRISFDPDHPLPAAPAHVAAALDRYLNGDSEQIELPVDLRHVRTDFHRDVLEHMARIPYGATATYQQLAAAAGRPTAVRAVGSACARNPLPLIIPCHRVVPSSGGIGNYAGRVARKQVLLALESDAA